MLAARSFAARHPQETSIFFSWQRPLATLMCLVASATAHAGLSLDEALTRSRALGDARGETAGLSPVTLDGGATDAATIAIGGPGDDVPTLLRPMLRGNGGLQVRARTTLGDGAVQARFGGAWWAGDDHPFSLDGSAIDTRFGNGRLYASVERRHWGPGWTSSLILDGGARPVPAVGWRKVDPAPFRTPLLAWLGPWNADVFAGQLSQDSGPRHAKLLGGRFQFMPIEGLELAVSRTIQWGGDGRPQSLGSLYRALVGEDNTYVERDPNEPGNQLAGFDARYTLRLGADRSVSVYGQAIGEDESGNLPSHYLGSAGVDTAFAFRGATLRLFAEAADTSMVGAFGSPLLGGAYRHHIYTDGYSHLGDPLGHPAGGDVRLASAGVFVEAGAWAGSFVAHRGRGYRTAQHYAPGARLSGANAELTWRLDAAARVGFALWHWNDGEARRTRGQLWWEIGFR